MAISREETAKLVEDILDGDQDAFERFYEQYDNIIYMFVGQWHPTIARATFGLYDFEDIHNETWAGIYERLESYDSEIANMTTWLYRVIPTIISRIKVHWERNKRNPGEEGIGYLNTYANDEDGTEIIDFLSDPSSAFEDNICTEGQVYEYAYIVKLLVDRLTTEKQRMVYMHQIKGLTLEASSCIIGLTRERVRQIRVKIMKKLESIRIMYASGKISPVEARNFAVELLSDKTDDQLCRELEYDLPTIKICREILSIAEIYVR